MPFYTAKRPQIRNKGKKGRQMEGERDRERERQGERVREKKRYTKILQEIMTKYIMTQK